MTAAFIIHKHEIKEKSKKKNSTKHFSFVALRFVLVWLLIGGFVISFSFVNLNENKQIRGDNVPCSAFDKTLLKVSTFEFEQQCKKIETDFLSSSISKEKCET